MLGIYNMVQTALNCEKLMIRYGSSSQGISILFRLVRQISSRRYYRV